VKGRSSSDGGVLSWQAEGDNVDSGAGWEIAIDRVHDARSEPDWPRLATTATSKAALIPRPPSPTPYDCDFRGFW